MTDETILCVDDDPTVLAALRALLGKLGPGHSIEIAENGAEALEIEEDLRQQGRSLAVVISDFLMPDMRGDELLVRLHQANPQTITIMLTGQSDFDGVKRAINHANLYRFLEKPFNSDDLLLTAKSACQAYEQQKELQRQNVELKGLNSELEQMLERLKNQQDELAKSEAKATISTLVASVSHELGTPIGNSALMVSSLADIANQIQKMVDSGQIRREALNTFIHQVRDAGDLLQRNLQRANTLLQNLKQVAADQASEQRRTFDLHTALREVLATMAPSQRNKPYQVKLAIPPGISMDSRPGTLGQVVINLVNNAYLHAFEGRDHGVLTISAEPAHNANGVRLSFADDGVGIPAEHMTRLLEPFFSTKIGRGGTGLGLSIVDNLVRKSLAGKLHIASTPGVGTTFTIDLPLHLSVP